MSFMRVKSILLILIASLFSSCVQADSDDCNQYQQFLGVTGGDKLIIWIGEHVSGGCINNYLHQLVFTNNKVEHNSVRLNYESVDLDGGNYFTEKQFSYFKQYDYTELDFTSGAIRMSSPAYKYTAAEIKSIETMGAEFKDRNGSRPIHLPTSNKNLKLLYAYEQGVYINYTIRRAILIKDFNVILVMVEQPIVSTSGTMHGFLLLKIEG